jgi:hypothetical protein
MQYEACCAASVAGQGCHQVLDLTQLAEARHSEDLTRTCRVAKKRQDRGAQKWTFCCQPCTSGSLRSHCMWSDNYNENC